MTILLLVFAFLYCAIATHGIDEIAPKILSNEKSLKDIPMFKPDGTLEEELLKGSFVAVTKEKSTLQRSKVPYPNPRPAEVPRNAPRTIAELSILPVVTDLTLAPVPITVTLPPVTTVTLSPAVEITLPPVAITLPPALSPTVADITLPPVVTDVTLPPALVPSVTTSLSPVLEVTLPPAVTIGTLSPAVVDVTLPPALAPIVADITLSPAVADVTLPPVLAGISLAPVPALAPTVASLSLPPVLADVTLPPVLAPSVAGITLSPALSDVTLPPVLAEVSLPPIPVSLTRAPITWTIPPSAKGLTGPPSAAGMTAPPNLSRYQPTHGPTRLPVSVPTISNVPSISNPVSAPGISQMPSIISAPSISVTLMPTHSENYMMMVTQVLNGIGASDFTSVSANGEAFKASVAGSFTGITSADVSITSCTDSTTVTASGGASAAHLLRRRLQGGSAVDVDYSITYNIATRGFSGDAQAGYEDMLAHLMLAVNGTLFNTLLAENALTYGASDMSGCTSGPVTSSGYQAAAADDDNSVNSSGNSEGLSKKDNLIIGLTVGIGGLLLVVLLISVWWYMASKNKAVE